MIVDLTLYDGTELNGLEVADNPVGVTYHDTKRVVIPGQEDEMRMVLIPWAAISKMEYILTADMVQGMQQQAVEEVSNQMNRKQRRAAGIQ